MLCSTSIDLLKTFPDKTRCRFIGQNLNPTIPSFMHTRENNTVHLGKLPHILNHERAPTIVGTTLVSHRLSRIWNPSVFSCYITPRLRKNALALSSTKIRQLPIAESDAPCQIQKKYVLRGEVNSVELQSNTQNLPPLCKTHSFSTLSLPPKKKRRINLNAHNER